MPVFVLLLVTVLGVIYAANVQRRSLQNGAVLGEVVESIHIEMLIKFNGREICYTTDALKPEASLSDLLDEFGQQGGILLGYRRDVEQEKDKITVIDTFLSDETENVTWYVYVNGVEYIGLFAEKVLLNGDAVSVIYE